MKALYNFEHKFIPILLHANDLSMADSFYSALVSDFQSLSLEVIQKYSNEEKVNDIVFATAMKSEFKSEKLSYREIDGIVFNILKLYFFFQPNPDFSPLCPCSYVISSNINGENIYHYFTIEYDSMVNDGNNRGSYWLCGWFVNKEGDLLHNNYGMLKLDDEIIIDKIFSIFMNNKKLATSNFKVRPGYKTKRSGYKTKSSGNVDSSCFVATATYGDAFHPDVVYLRYYRDKYLSRSVYGRTFIKFYYCVGPYLSLLPKHFLIIKKMSRKLIEKIVIVLKQKYD